MGEKDSACFGTLDNQGSWKGLIERNTCDSKDNFWALDVNFMMKIFDEIRTMLSATTLPIAQTTAISRFFCH